MLKRFLSTIWIELVALILTVGGLELWVVPICIDARDNLLFWVAMGIWVLTPVLTLWVVVDMIRRWLRFNQKMKDSTNAK